MVGTKQWQRAGLAAMWLSLAKLDKFRRNFGTTGKHQGSHASNERAGNDARYKTTHMNEE